MNEVIFKDDLEAEQFAQELREIFQELDGVNIGTEIIEAAGDLGSIDDGGVYGMGGEKRIKVRDDEEDGLIIGNTERNAEDLLNQALARALGEPAPKEDWEKDMESACGVNDGSRPGDGEQLFEAQLEGSAMMGGIYTYGEF